MPALLMVDPEVQRALRERAPVVALESAVLTHGLPRPHNLEVVQRMIAAVRHAGAIPAVVAVLGGVLHVGLGDAALAEIAGRDGAHKLSARDLAWAHATGSDGGTTVAATLAACGLAGVRVFATGGIGGVHRGWREHLDISADIEALASAPCCTVAAGGKSILDLPATLEALETRGVPVIGWRTDHFPQFHSRGHARLPAPRRLDTLEQVALLCRARWDALAQPGGVLLANPIPEEHALPQRELDDAVAQAQRDADARGIRGAALTPFLLAALERITAGRSVTANLALLEHNAALAGELARALAG
ncbi:MAG: pseudouridine-5'-phosphate glycosidase [Myxococcales bacterium]|nr:pseudouridine-5'-phosphate glycosidase [Myxococcales bacterium]